MPGIENLDVVPNHWVRSILALPHLSEHRQEALDAAGLSRSSLEDIGGPIPRGSETALLDFFSDRLNSAYVGAEIGVALDPRNNSLLTYILFNSHTLHDAIHHVQRFTPITRPRARIELRETKDHIDFIVDGVGPNLLLNLHLIEFSLGAMLGALRTATDTEGLAIQVGLANPRRNGRRELAEIYGCPVELGADQNYLRFPLSVMDTAIRGADEHLLGHLTSYGEVLLSRNTRHPATLAETVERHLLHGMASGRPKLGDTADALGMSERTLNRRLQMEGTSFRDLVSNTQMKLARAFLSDPNLSLAETAHLCGFSDQSSFTQAYRRMTGKTPKADRILLIKSNGLR
ncbi:AraC family transcriptional regulator ligand-binding domain-containing protein [Shimia sp.]|uniref:helix-turn-helix transcriptional regulator n=1 Tax=Shimia sp. TaxID=1954381 RepID=UPI003BAB9662